MILCVKHQVRRAARLALLICAISFVALCARAQCTPRPEGIVAWWPADGNTIDQVGANNGTLQGAATYAPGEVGQAFSFNGFNGSVLIPDSPSLELASAMTIEAWVYPKARGTGFPCEIVSKWYGNGNQMSFSTSIDNSGLAYIIVSSDGAATDAGIDYLTLYTANTVPLNQWTHFAATYDGAQLRIYLNGVLEGQADWTNGLFPGTAPLVIGATAAASVFNGLIDEPALYNRALSDTEIQAVYYAGSAGKCGYPPSILNQPQSQTVYAGSSVNFTSSVSGAQPLSYQWVFNATDIPGATGFILNLTNVQINQAGTYSLRVTNSFGATNTDDAVLIVNSLPPCVPIASGVAGWWPAENNALDEAGTNSGALAGSVSYVSGLIGQAFDFHGGSVFVPDSPWLRPTNALTVEAWINPRTWGSSREIVSKWFGSGNQNSYTTAINSSGNAYLYLSVNGSSAANGVDHLELYSSGTVPVNQWTHFAATFDGSVASIFLNGVLDSQISWTNNIFAGTAPLYIGKAATISAFDGLIDEPAIYNRALSALEIQAIASASVSGKCPLSPVILSPPQNQTVISASSVTFRVTAGGQKPLSYQWSVNSTNISGATNATLTITNVQLGQSGTYSILISNSIGDTSTSAVLTVNPPPPCLPAPAGIVAWWTAESNALDQAGINDGTLGGSVGYIAGLVGRAFDFHGGSVSVVDSSWLRLTNAITVEAWINPRSWGSSHEIISKWFGTGNQNSYTTAVDSSGHAYFLLSVNGSSVANGLDHLELYSTNTVPVNQWTYFAATFDGAVAKIYLNGALDGQAIWTNRIFAGTAPLYIGKAAGQSAFDGAIDEPAIYNRALSVSEIQAIFGAVSGKCPLPASILGGPQSLLASVGSNVAFSVSAGGARPLLYQWKFNTTPIVNATNSVFTLTNVQPSSAGGYSVAVSNSLNGIVSSNAMLKVNVVLAFGNGVLITNPQNSYAGSVTVQLQNLYSNGLVFYTLDGSVPSFSSAQYTGPFSLSHSAVLRTLGYSPDFFQSAVSDPVSLLIVPSFALAASSGGGGSVGLSPAGGAYLSNSVVVATATPSNGWAFLQWLGDAGGTNPVTSVTMSRNKSIKAIFGTTLATTGAGNGLVTPIVGVYPYGTVVPISAAPQAGNYFAIWGNAASGNLNPLYFVVTNANPTVSALFQPLGGGQAALAVIPNGRGKVTVNPNANVYVTGAGVTLTAVPDPTQLFIGWSGDAAGTSNPLGITMSQSKVITANFTRKSTLTVTPPQGGVTDQGFQFTLDGDFGGVYRLDSSTGLVSWLPLMTVTNSYGKLQFVDPQGTNSPRKFYRAVQLQ